MQYNVRNRRRLRPATRDLVPAMPVPQVAAPELARRPEGSGLHRRPLVTEINLSGPGRGRDR